MKPCLCFSIREGMCLVLVLVVLPPALHAQTAPPRFTHQIFTTDDGLPTNLLTDLVQTPDGYLWIGTQDGLEPSSCGCAWATTETGTIQIETSQSKPSRGQLSVLIMGIASVSGYCDAAE